MTQPSAKTEFSNKGMAKLLGELYLKNYDVAWNRHGERLRLIINGDLHDDIKGFDLDLEVRGNVHSSIDISGDLITRSSGYGHVKTSGGQTVSVNNLIMSTSANIEGDGVVNVRRDISGNMYSISGEGSGLTLNCGGNVQCSTIGNNVNVVIDGNLTVGTAIKANGVESHVTANHIKANSISGSKARVFSATDIDVTYAVSGGAKAYAAGTIRSESIGCPVGRGCGFEGRTLAYAEKVEMRTLPYNAEVLSSKPVDVEDLRDPYIGHNDNWPKEPQASVIYNLDDKMSSAMIDFLRLGASALAKRHRHKMPDAVKRAVNTALRPA